MITANDVKVAIEAWPCRYATKEGRVVIGNTVSSVSQQLRDAGWRGVPRFDEQDLHAMGLEIVSAQYINGARPTGKFVPVVVVREGK